MSRDRKYSRHCGQQKEFDVESDRKFFRVTFKSNDRYDGTGFNASYVFVDEEGNYTTKPPTSNASTLKGKTIYILFFSSTNTTLPTHPLSSFHARIFTSPTQCRGCPFYIYRPWHNFRATAKKLKWNSRNPNVIPLFLIGQKEI